MNIVRMRPDRAALVGSLAVRPVLHRGANGAAFPVSIEPIHGLVVTAGRRGTKGIFHPGSNVHGFLELPPGPTLISISDPERRYLPRTISLVVPDTAPSKEALERGGRPAKIATTIVEVPLRPSAEAPEEVGVTGLFGVARETDGRPIRLAWIRASTAQGSYVTYSDLRGEFVIPLPFLRPVTVVASTGLLPTDGDDLVTITDTFPVTLQAHRPVKAVAANAKIQDVFPPNFDALLPGGPGFDTVYQPASFLPLPTRTITLPIKISTRVRQDLTP